MSKCKVCGKDTLPGYEYCIRCNPDKGKKEKDVGYQQQRSGRGDRRGGTPYDRIPDECIFRHGFYDPDGYLKREVNIESAEKMAYILQDKGISQTSVRQLFNSIKHTESMLISRPEMETGFIREKFGKFVTDVEYQSKRGVIPFLFKDFVRAHLDIAESSVKEFKGFVAYLTAIVCRMKQK